MEIRKEYQLTDPPFLTALFSDKRWAWIWIPVRRHGISSRCRASSAFSAAETAGKASRAIA